MVTELIHALQLFVLAVLLGLVAYAAVVVCRDAAAALNNIGDEP